MAERNGKDRYTYHIYEAVRGTRETTSLHVPGHKQSREFSGMFPGSSLDTTEISRTDNLAAPSGCIKAAEDDIAEILGAERSFITTDGTTSGIHALVYAASRRGGKILLPANSHMSALNACAVMGVEPVIISGGTEDGMMKPPAAGDVRRALEKDADISAYLAVSPDYYGNIAPLAEYRDAVKGCGRLFLCDGAHGAHLFTDRDIYCGTYADAWTDGAHKTLPCLTQGAVVSVNNRDLTEDVRQGLLYFRTSSPSYPVMASVEYGVKYLAGRPEAAEAAKAGRAALCAALPVPVYGGGGDWTKLVLDLGKAGLSGEKLCTLLEEGGFYPEFFDGRYMLICLSPMTDFARLSYAVDIIFKALTDGSCRADRREPECLPARCERKMPYLEALRAPWEYVPLGEAGGRIAAANAGRVPPCTADIVAGCEINGGVIRRLSCGTVFGVEDGMIKAVKIS